MQADVRAFAPGRVNLIGEHTDHTGGRCLPMAVAMGVHVDGRREGGRVLLSSHEVPGPVDVPFTVIHGAEDNLVTPSGGRRTAEAVPHAKLIEIDGMGHNLPQGLWSEIHDHIEATIAAAS